MRDLQAGHHALCICPQQNESARVCVSTIIQRMICIAFLQDDSSPIRVGWVCHFQCKSVNFWGPLGHLLATTPPKHAWITKTKSLCNKMGRSTTLSYPFVFHPHWTPLPFFDSLLSLPLFSLSSHICIHFHISPSQRLPFIATRYWLFLLSPLF